MRSQLGKAVRSKFEAQLKHHLPQFDLVRGEDVPAGRRLHRWKIRDDMYAFPPPQMGREDEFTLEGGWSHDEHFPFNIFPGLPLNFPELGITRDEPSDGRFRFRLKRLWDPRGPEFWEIVPKPSFEERLRRLDLISQGLAVDPPIELLAERIDSLVSDAIRRIEDHAIPYFLSISHDG